LRILPYFNCSVVVSSENAGGMPLARQGGMNPKAEELKRRTFKFALAVISFCRSLRETWEGRELSQSQLTAKANAAAYATPRKRRRSSGPMTIRIPQ
jgi:hypothetical protein